MSLLKTIPICHLTVLSAIAVTSWTSYSFNISSNIYKEWASSSSLNHINEVLTDHIQDRQIHALIK